jgi:DNA-binding protein YbaB
MSAPPFGGPPLDQDRVRQLNQQMATMASQAREAAEQLNQIAVSATSRNRAVTVTVGSGGILKSVKPGPAAAGASAAHLCSAVMEAYGQASRQAAEEASALMQRVTGKDTQVMQMMRAAMPQDPDEEQPR